MFPQRAATSYVKVLSPSQAQGRIRAGDLIVNDLRRYWAFASILEVMNRNPLVQERERSLAALVAAVPAVEIGLTKSVTREQLVATINGLMAWARMNEHRYTDCTHVVPLWPPWYFASRFTTWMRRCTAASANCG